MANQFKPQGFIDLEIISDNGEGKVGEVRISQTASYGQKAGLTSGRAFPLMIFATGSIRTARSRISKFAPSRASAAVNYVEIELGKAAGAGRRGPLAQPPPDRLSAVFAFASAPINKSGRRSLLGYPKSKYSAKDMLNEIRKQAREMGTPEPRGFSQISPLSGRSGVHETKATHSTA